MHVNWSDQLCITRSVLKIKMKPAEIMFVIKVIKVTKRDEQNIYGSLAL